MKSHEWITLVAASIAAVASAVGAAVSVHSARFRRFASERWWERKAEAYGRLIDLLTGLSMNAKYLDVELGCPPEYADPREVVDAAWTKLGKQLSDLGEEVLRGAFAVSERCVAECGAFLKQARGNADHLDDTIVEKLPPLITIVRAEAKRDLSID